AVAAFFGGAGALTSSLSAPLAVRVLSPTATVVVSSSPTAAAGSPVTWTATVSAGAAGAGTPAGAVTFFDVFAGVQRVPGAGAVAAHSGQAHLTRSDLRPGAHLVFARYTPAAGSDFLASMAKPIRQVVQAGARTSSRRGGFRDPFTAVSDALFTQLARETQ